MATMVGRKAASLYHHIAILEEAGFLERAGTRPKGKRFEALFRLTADRFEVDPRGDEGAVDQAVKAMGTAFRMTERDLAAALVDDRCETEGPERNLFAARLHLRASPRLLAAINKHLQAIETLIEREAAKAPRPTPRDQHLSLTLALLPIKGRNTAPASEGS